MSRTTRLPSNRISPVSPNGRRSDEPRLAFQHIVKRFGARTVLDDVTLDVPAQHIVVLLGPSGSGKTTLLRCAAGIERVSGGVVRIDGQAVDDGRAFVPPERRRLGMVFQDYALWPHLTVLENAAYPLRRRRVGAGEARQQARAVLARVGLAALVEHYPGQLSGGEQQRVALARALIARPSLLLFDEPLSNLDANLREQMRVEIATLVREAAATALYITHDQAEAFALADEIGVLEAGRLRQFGPPESIYTAPASPFVARLTGIAGTLRGEVTTLLDAGRVEVAAGPLRLRATRRDSVAPGSPVQVLLRPAALELTEAGAERVGLSGTVVDSAFAGRGYEHVVAIGDQRLTGVFAPRRWVRGEVVGLRLDPAGAFVFHADP
ncbi:MAG TPA: ABC transporter ATP-binding protein, partial [Thermomicrobiaceae bacterium]|nr:ABC transporter ATP-binding protein [Thermomicrobiaceae bacterium]